MVGILHELGHGGPETESELGLLVLSAATKMIEQSQMPMKKCKSHMHQYRWVPLIFQIPSVTTKSPFTKLMSFVWNRGKRSKGSSFGKTKNHSLNTVDNKGNLMTCRDLQPHFDSDAASLMNIY